jgi:hypothetical protein
MTVAGGCRTFALCAWLVREETGYVAGQTIGFGEEW